MKVWIKRIFITLATIMMVALCGLFAACGEPEAIDQTTIKYDGKTITWQAVDAEKYEVSINGGTVYTAPTAAFNYPVDSSVQTVEITITAYNGDKASESVTKLFTRLEKIQKADITFDENGKMTWPAISGATEYVLKINGQEKRTPATEYTDFIVGQTNTIQIMPMAAGDSSFSEWSEQLIKEYLGVPSGLKYDGQFITWQGNTKARAYQIYIDGVAYGEPVTSTSLVYDSGATGDQDLTVDFQIQAIGNGDSSFHSPIGDAEHYVFLKDIKDIRVEDGILVWGASEVATGYEVMLNNVKQVVETNSLNNLPANKDNKIQIKPVVSTEGTRYFANWTQEITVRVLVAPDWKWDDTMVLDGEKMNVLTWDKVDGDVAGYNVKIVDPTGASRVVNLPENAVSFGDGEDGEAFEITGSYKLSIQTVATTGSNSYNSQYCQEHEVIRLAAPNASTQNFITSTPDDVTEGFKISWQSVSGASGYQLYKETAKLGGTVTNTIATVAYRDIMSEDETEALKINYSVQAVGNVKTFGTQRKITLSSLTKDSLKAEINVLAQPQNLTIQEYEASWTAVTGATQYALTVGDHATSNTSTYDLKNLTAGTYDFGVCAKGNGGDLLASNYTATKKIVRLGAPINIEIDPTSNGDKLTWEGKTQYAQHYYMFWEDDVETAVDASTFIGVEKQVTTDGRSLFMRAAANYWNDETTKDVYYMTSQPSQTVQFTKLEAPKFDNDTYVNADATKLVWNAAGNVQNSSITYRVWDGSETLQAEGLTGCEYDISKIAGGAEYTYKIQAVGYGTKVSSAMSAPATFWKLPTPVLNAFEDGDKEYEWKIDADADQYIVKEGDLNPVSVKFDKTQDTTCSYAPSFITANAHGVKVKIYAQGNGKTVINSSPLEINQIVEKASKPGFTVEFQNQAGETITQNEENSKIVIKLVENSLPISDGYRVTLKGSGAPISLEIKNGELQCEYALRYPDKYTIEVFAKGKAFGENGIYYVESDSQQAQTLTVYNAPTDIQKTAGGKITWTGDSNAKKHKYIVTYTDADGATKTIEGTTTNGVTTVVLELPDGVSASNDITKIEIYAVGDGQTTISSIVTEKGYGG